MSVLQQNNKIQRCIEIIRLTSISLGMMNHQQQVETIETMYPLLTKFVYPVWEWYYYQWWLIMQGWILIHLIYPHHNSSCGFWFFSFRVLPKSTVSRLMCVIAKLGVYMQHIYWINACTHTILLVLWALINIHIFT